MLSSISSDECIPPSTLGSFGWSTGQELTFDRNFDLEDVHVEGAERIAEAVAKYDVDRFIHVSSYNANVNSPSEFFAAKVSKSSAEMKSFLTSFLGTWRGCSS